MNRFAVWSVAMVLSMARVAIAVGPQDPLLPVTTPPIVYTINYSGDFFTHPRYLERFQAAPPDLLHVGKAVPVSHLWGPTAMYAGENQWTGGPGHTLSWENIALISPQQLAERIETIRQTLRRYHEIGIPEIVPYISYHALAGDHEKRLGFWKFYDQWDSYAQWVGPKPTHDPVDWLVVDRQGKLVGGSCGGYSPDYFAPLHRYRACIRHPDWIAWQRRLVRLVAEVGYDGCFVDNASTPDHCYCRYCKAALPKFLQENRDLDWVRRLTKGLRADQLTLDSPDVPAELVRRFRLLYLRDYLAGLRAAGREVNPRFTIFPNGNVIRECLTTGAESDRLMFESSYSPGILTADELDCKLDFDDVRKYGLLGLGTAGAIVIPEDTDIRKVLLNVTRFYAHESCGQCTQCREGTSWMYKIAQRIADDAGRVEDLDLIEELTGSMGMMPGLSICGLPDGAVYPIRTIVQKYRKEFEAHIAAQPPGRVAERLADVNQAVYELPIYGQSAMAKAYQASQA